MGVPLLTTSACQWDLLDGLTSVVLLMDLDTSVRQGLEVLAREASGVILVFTKFESLSDLFHASGMFLISTM